MSRIGKKPIIIPKGVEITLEGHTVKAKGPKGELQTKIRPEIGVEIKDDQVIVTPVKETKKSNAFWGLSRSLIANMTTGVSEGYQTKLLIEGVGYKVALEGQDLVFQLGFSHPVKISPREGIIFSIEKNSFIVSGINKQLVTQVAANIRKIKPPDPYKGKGIRYEGEIIKKKVGKKATGARG